MRSCRRFWPSGDSCGYLFATSSHFSLRLRSKPSHSLANGANASRCEADRSFHAGLATSLDAAGGVGAERPPPAAGDRAKATSATQASASARAITRATNIGIVASLGLLRLAGLQKHAEALVRIRLDRRLVEKQGEIDGSDLIHRPGALPLVHGDETDQQRDQRRR